eukprot:jgi/Antlo1/408/896
MAIIKRLLAKGKSCHIHKTATKNLCFELPAEPYGKKHQTPSFTRPPRPLKFCIPRIDNESLSAVFVSSSDSLGIFFLKKNTPVYITEPVYEQLKMKIKHYETVSTHYVDEKMQNCMIRDMSRARCPALIKINLNQSFKFDSIVVKAISAGTFLGWTNYYVKEQYYFLYARSLLIDTRFAAQAPDVPVDFLILNRDTDANCLGEYKCLCGKETERTKITANVLEAQNDNSRLKVRILTSTDDDTLNSPLDAKKLHFGIEALTAYLSKSRSEKVAVLCDFSTHFLEIALHAFYILKDVHIFIMCKELDEYKQRLSYMGEFLSSSLRMRMYKGTDPLPLSLYTNLHVISDTCEISQESYLLFTELSLNLSNHVVLSINSLKGHHCFFISFETPLHIIRERLNASIVLNEEYYNTTNRCILHGNGVLNDEDLFAELIVKNMDTAEFMHMDAGKNYFIDTESGKETLEIQCSDLVYAQNGQAWVEGNLEYTDRYGGDICRLILTAKTPKIRELFAKEQYYFFNGFYVFPESGYRINFEKRPYIEKVEDCSSS